ncbi:hypothetical protein [Hymenobacter weizhouensis]|uniref:hypothetical protein n=1 Tax=Hymenobacter sp. YIM 151500-1 TaxID=2987689 RepID=UPI002226F204|nr:hypothetical protein [Hymenobacter sp. YIM 151500-1]UYZ62966.1 hypothetical protein OIS53_18475 [Hymenobacter sp. YIM 151500-1]
MKILLDENLPGKLRFDFAPEHTAHTVQEMGWSGKKDGELLGLLTISGFDALVTVDKSLPYQQNLQRFPLIIFLLKAPNNKHQTLQPLVDVLKARIHSLSDFDPGPGSGKASVIEIQY